MSCTIRDVAKLAGVAVSTASLALNGHKSVRDTTRERVLQAAAKLHYQPNAVARSLVTHKTQTIGVLMPDLGDPYYHEIFGGIDQWAHDNEYSVVLAYTKRDAEREAHYLQVLQEKRVDGIIFMGAGFQEDQHLQPLLTAMPPVVLIGRHHLPFPSIVPDNEGGAYAALSHLLQLGHRNIAIVTGPMVLTTVQDRLAGCRRALADYGVAYRPELVIHADFTPEGGLVAMQKLLQRTSIPTAVFAGNDQMAFGAVQAIYAAGWRIPEHISVIGFGDIPLSRYLYPSLSTVSIPLRQMGRQAAEMLASIVNKEEQAQEGSHLLPVKLVCRASTRSII